MILGLHRHRSEEIRLAGEVQLPRLLLEAGKVRPAVHRAPCGEGYLGALPALSIERVAGKASPFKAYLQREDVAGRIVLPAPGLVQAHSRFGQRGALAARRAAERKHGRE